MSLLPQVSGEPLDVVKAYKNSLPPNYGPGAVFTVDVKTQTGGLVVNGRVLREQDKQALNRLLTPAVNNLMTFPYLGALSYGVIHAPKVDMRSRAANDGELVSQAVAGDGVLLLAKDAQWYEIFRQWDGYVGWVPADALQTMDKKQFQQWQQHIKRMVLADSPANFAGAIILNEKVPFTRSLIEPITPQQLQARVLQYAQALYVRSRTESFPYLWGGTYGTALDCSGFNQTVFRLAGLAIPRDSYQQQLFGQAIPATPEDMTALQPGDLIFFNEKKDQGRTRATHTGIYMGNGEFFHSSGGKGNRGLGRNRIQGDLPYEGFLRSIWWGAARVIPSQVKQTSQGLFPVSEFS
jgi:gamma-D-glutamyl-L-lysine dipeptidyl-peptidase